MLSPQLAVLWAAFFNFIAFAVFGLHVATTVGTGIIDPAVADPHVILGALGGAIVWNLLTWWLGIPASSSHALIGGLVGAALAKTHSMSVLVWSGLAKTLAAIVLSPLLGFMLALLVVLVVSWLCVRSTPFAVDQRFRTLQFISAALYSLGHGGNDAQKTIGLIGLLLFSQGYLGPQFHIPFWVVLACQAAMAIGTMLGGWRIVRTMGSRITHLAPARVLHGKLGRRDPFRCDLARSACEHNAYDHRRDHGRWSGPTDERCQVGCGQEHCRFMGPDHPGLRSRSRAGLPAGKPDFLIRLARNSRADHKQEDLRHARRCPDALGPR